ncbi:MAG: hypothetical protein Pars2KO_01500 [Parasphingorhabdus sp.]
MKKKIATASVILALGLSAAPAHAGGDDLFVWNNGDGSDFSESLSFSRFLGWFRAS